MNLAEAFESVFDAEGRMRILDGMRYYKKTEAQNNMPRFVVSMKEPVDRACLQCAAEKAMARFRVQRMVVAQDGERFYLKENNRRPVVHADDGCRHVVCTEENNGHMTWIGCRENSITIEFFHGVSDGAGMIPFIGALLHAYCTERYGEADASAQCAGPFEAEENPLEYVEAVRFLPEEMATAEPGYTWKAAAQLKGVRVEEGHSCKYYELVVDGQAFEACMRANGSSRSAMFAMFMNHAVARFHDVGEAPVVGALAVNARRAYGAEGTMQCCVATIPLWLDGEVMAMPMADRLRLGRQMILEGTQPQRIRAAAQRTKQFNARMEAQFPTLEGKKAYCREINRAGSTKYSYGISYVGEISFGEYVDRHIAGVRTLLCANTIPVILEITKFAGQYLISYCSQFEHDVYVEAFRQMFISAGIPCTLRQGPDYEESYAAF